MCVCVCVCALLKALPQVPMKYTAGMKIKWQIKHKVKLSAIRTCHKTIIMSSILSYKRSGSASSVLLYFTLIKE